MNPTDRFWQNVRADQDEAREQAAYLPKARALGGAGADVPRTSVRRRSWIVLAAALCVAGTVGLASVSALRNRADLRFSVGGEAGHVGAWLAAPSGDALSLRFSDGSLFSLSAGSRARVSAVDASGARVVLERGRASVSVVHRPATRWLVEVGPFEVSVVGTRFDVGWDANDEVFQLGLAEGVVLVSGPCLHEPRPVARGEGLRVHCKGEVAEIDESRAGPDGSEESRVPASLLGAPSPSADSSAVPAKEASGPPAAVIASGERAPQAPAPRRAGPPDVAGSTAWRTLTSSGRFREALELVEQRGFDEECRRASGADLLELGDAARFAGNPARARQAYLAARSKLPGGGRSAYSLGLTAFDQEKDFALAARWFEAYLTEQPEGGLRGEAEGRLMEAWQRAGDPRGARTAAERYLREYPNGTQAPLARQLVAQ